jgi:uncharacterized membrane protein
MEIAKPRRLSHKLAWLIFILLLAFAIIFVNRSAAALPSIVAVHFDAAGRPNGFMSHGDYWLFALILTLGLPLGVVGVLTLAYSRATDLKLPNREYWLAPQRVEHTRAFLVAHGVWLGAMLVAFMCYVHWLVLDANARQPPQLSNEWFAVGIAVFLIGVAAWVATMMVAFRRGGSE